MKKVSLFLGKSKKKSMSSLTVRYNIKVWPGKIEDEEKFQLNQPENQ